MRSRRSRRSLKLSHTQTSVPCGTLNKLIIVSFERSKIMRMLFPLLKDGDAQSHDSDNKNLEWLHELQSWPLCPVTTNNSIIYNRGV